MSLFDIIPRSSILYLYFMIFYVYNVMTSVIEIDAASILMPIKE